MIFKRKARPQIFVKNSLVSTGTFEGLIQSFLSQEKKQIEMRDVYLDFARELASTWKTLIDIRAPIEIIQSQEILISQEVQRAWQGRIELSQKDKSATAYATNGFAMDLLTGRPVEFWQALP